MSVNPARVEGFGHSSGPHGQRVPHAGNWSQLLALSNRDDPDAQEMRALGTGSMSRGS
jgi:hypothetical protein